MNNIVVSTIGDESVNKIISSIENVAPKAWDLLIKAQKADAIQDIVICVSILIFSAIGIIIIWRVTKDLEKDDKEIIRVFSAVIAIIIMLITIPYTAKSYVQYANAEAFAAKDLLNKAAR